MPFLGRLLLAMVVVGACAWVVQACLQDYALVERFELGRRRALLVEREAWSEDWVSHFRVRLVENGTEVASTGLGWWANGTWPAFEIIQCEDIAGIVLAENPNVVIAIYDLKTAELLERRTRSRKANVAIQRLAACSGRSLSWDWPR